MVLFHRVADSCTLVVLGARAERASEFGSGGLVRHGGERPKGSLVQIKVLRRDENPSPLRAGRRAQSGSGDDVLEFPDIARPFRGGEQIKGLGGESNRPAADLPSRVVGEHPRQNGDIFHVLTQWRDSDAPYVESVQKIGAEAAVAHLQVQVAVRGGEDPDVDSNRLIASYALQFAVLEDSQQLGLDERGQFPDLVEEQAAAVGDAELA